MEFFTRTHTHRSRVISFSVRPWALVSCRHFNNGENLVSELLCCQAENILGDPGAVSGGRESLNRREKNSGEEKSRTKIRAPGDKVLTDQFQTVGVILASDWCQKIFVFFCPITEQQD